MRLFLIALPVVLPVVALTACAVPSPQSATPVAAAPFNAPMDPGMISCGQLSNPAALAVATDWALGQARAGILAGTQTDLPSADTISSSLGSYCSANPSDTLRTASRQIGI